MGISGITFLCATRLLASWIVLPFVHLGGIGWGFFASYLAVVHQVGCVSAGGYSLIFWELLVGCYYGFTASGGPIGVGVATAKSMVVNLVSVHIIGMLGTQLFWGANPRARIGG